MAKMSVETKARIREAARHPVVWWKGADLTEEKIRPWEGGIQFFAETLKGFMSGFTDMKNRLYKGLGEGKIPPNWLSIKDVITVSWDGINDPIIGAYMDRRRYAANIHRWVMRFNATYSPINILLQCFSFGLTPMQRLVQWIIMEFFASLVSTTNAVSESKIWAGITPHSKQRGILQLWKTLGDQTRQGVSALPLLLIGFKDALGITDYQIMVWGALVFTPVTIFARWLPSYAKQRVDFNIKQPGEPEEPPSLRESFSVVRHNSWFIMNTVIGLITVLTPKTDKMYLYRFLLPKMNFLGKPVGGEVLLFVKNSVAGTLGTILQPFALQAIRMVGGELNMLRLNSAIEAVTNLLKFLVGYNTFGKFAFMIAMDMIFDITNKWKPVAEKVIDYQMLDYVEWRTGLRSEGMTMAVGGFLTKLLKDNVGKVFSNAVEQWTGYLGYDIPVEQQPARFIDTIWPLLHIGAIFSSTLYFIGRAVFKYPADRAQVEADLIARRALAAAAKEEAKLVE